MAQITTGLSPPLDEKRGSRQTETLIFGGDLELKTTSTCVNGAWVASSEWNKHVHADAGLPPWKWSSLRYGFWPCGGLNDAEEETHV